MGPEASVVSKFGCMHEVQMPLPPTPTSCPSAVNSPSQLLIRRVVGELEVTVAWDRNVTSIFPVSGYRFASSCSAELTSMPLSHVLYVH